MNFKVYHFLSHNETSKIKNNARSENIAIKRDM